MDQASRRMFAELPMRVSGRDMDALRRRLYPLSAAAPAAPAAPAVCRLVQLDVERTPWKRDVDLKVKHMHERI